MVRHKNRYIVVEITPEYQQTRSGDLPLREFAIKSTIFSKVHTLYGDFGVASIQSGFMTKYCNAKTRIAMVRARHGPHRFVISALSCINKIEGVSVSLRTLYMGATVRQCFKFILNYQQKKVDEVCVKLKTDEEKTAVKDALLNFESLKSLT